MTHDLSSLYRTLGYRFTREELIHEALTHRSLGAHNNERLEFLGDAILSFIITAELYQRFPHADEGELSRLRARLVKGETLAVAARAYKLGDYLRLGAGELKSGGFNRDSILANALEALIGAIYLDQGLEQAGIFVLATLQDTLKGLAVSGSGKDPKTLLQEYLQGRGLPLPEYEVLKVEGEAHAQSFQVSCRVHGMAQSTVGEGSSRRKAEQGAAQKALELLVIK